MAYVENVAAFLEYSLSFKLVLHFLNYVDKPDFDKNNLVSEARKTLFGEKSWTANICIFKNGHWVLCGFF